MKALVAALILAMLLPCGAFASTAAQQRSLMAMLAQAYAMTRLCSLIEMNENEVALLVVLYGLDLKANEQWMTAAVQAQMAPWAGKPADSACPTGIALYGQKGSALPNLIQIR